MNFRLLAACLITTTVSLTPSLRGAEPGAYEQEITAWHAKRVERLTAPTSWLSLIGRHWIKPGAQTVGSEADNAIVLAAGPAHLGTLTLDEGAKKLHFVVAPGTGARIDGAEKAEADIIPENEDPHTTLSAGSVSATVIERGGRYALRVKDSEAKTRKNFHGIERFPTDASWRIEARWVPFNPPAKLPITNVISVTSEENAPGKAVFERDGQTYELWPIEEEPNGPLFFIIKDLTSGVETYGASRFLYADQPKDGRIILDFNKAYNPPCAFTEFATCPLPPKQNKLKLRITAGEKAYGGHE